MARGWADREKASRGASECGGAGACGVLARMARVQRHFSRSPSLSLEAEDGMARVARGERGRASGRERREKEESSAMWAVSNAVGVSFSQVPGQWKEQKSLWPGCVVRRKSAGLKQPRPPWPGAVAGMSQVQVILCPTHFLLFSHLFSVFFSSGLLPSMPLCHPHSLSAPSLCHPLHPPIHSPSFHFHLPQNINTNSDMSCLHSDTEVSLSLCVEMGRTLIVSRVVLVCPKESISKESATSDGASFPRAEMAQRRDCACL